MPVKSSVKFFKKDPLLHGSFCFITDLESYNCFNHQTIEFTTRTVVTSWEI
jgi:hypothetical protein